MTRERIKALLPELKLICEVATGYNNLDIKAAKNFGIRVTNVAEYAKYSVSQQIFSYILNFATKITDYNEDVRRGLWEKSNTFDLLNYQTFELYRKKIGIIGFGIIGQEVARIAEAFRMEVLPYDIVDISETGYKNFSIDQILSTSDFIVLQCPLFDSTRNLIDNNAFAKMKKNAIFINASRGGLVDEIALVEALKSNSIAGAAVDVLTNEPPKEGNILLKSELDNLIITPHSAWSTLEARQRLIDKVACDIGAYLNGELKDCDCIV